MRTGASLRGIHQRPGWEHGEPASAGGAEEVWSRVEDLWWRLWVHVPLAVNVREAELLWRGLKRLPLWDADLLRVRALDLETYQWWDDGRRRTLVSLMDWEGEDLLQRLTPPQQVRRWPGAEGVAASLQAFLHRHAAAGGRH